MKLKTHLVKMVLSFSKDEFDITLKAAQDVQDGHLESNLALFADCRGTFASYCLADIPGNRGLHGNACSEQNHSSVLCYLNDGNKQGNNYCEHPILLIKDLLQRQQIHLKRVNKMLFGMTQKRRVEID